jgi:hypothetical protein
MGFVSRKRGLARLIRSRKGDILHEIYFLIFQLLIVFMVVFALFQYVNNVASDLGFDKRVTAIDLGFLTTAVYYAPGILVHSYTPLPFTVPMDIFFADSLVNVKERAKELDMFYWFAQDAQLELFQDKVMVNAVEKGKPQTTIMTYYKSGGAVNFDKKKVNALQLVCPVVNTSAADWKSRKIFVGKVLPKQEDYSKQDLPVNRIVQVLAARSSQIVTGTSQQAPQQGSVISAIPSDAELVIILGNSGEKREPGSLVAYIPVNDNLMKERKFACLMINDLLTPESVVFYTQVMPVFVDTLKDQSPLRIFREISNPSQVIVFIDISTFTNDQITVDNVVNAISRSIERYYGASKLPPISGSTLSFVTKVTVQPQVQTQPTVPVQDTVAPKEVEQPVAGEQEI